MTQFPNSDKTQKLQKCVFAKPLGRTPDRVCSAQTESQTRASRKKQPQNYDREPLLTAPCRENHCDKSNHDLSELLQHLPPNLALNRPKNQDFSARNTSDHFRCTQHPNHQTYQTAFLQQKHPQRGLFPLLKTI